jgi:hypothetical protein
LPSNHNREKDNRMKNMGHDKKNNRLHERIGLLMVRGQYRSALELLGKKGGDWSAFAGQASLRALIIKEMQSGTYQSFRSDSARWHR